MCGNCRRAQLPVHRSIMRLHVLYLAEHLLFVAPTYAPVSLPETLRISADAIGHTHRGSDTGHFC